MNTYTELYNINLNRVQGYNGATVAQDFVDNNNNE